MDKNQQWQDILNKIQKDSPFDNPELSNLDTANIDLKQLPEMILGQLEEITQSYDQIIDEKDRLADELLVYYDFVNTTFTSTIEVAKCDNIQQAVVTLADEISRAIKSCYCYYIGPLTKRFSYFDIIADQNNKGQKDQVMVWPRELENSEKAHEYYKDHLDKINALIESEVEFKIDQFEPRGSFNHDDEGMADVLMIHLRGEKKDMERLGSFVFVRSQDEPYFIGVEMNMACTLARMGTVVLGNILYAEKIDQVYLQTITSLVRAMEAKDYYTSGHSSRVSAMACLLGEYIGVDASELEQLEWAGLLHDIGKIGIRDDVLCKAGRLTDEEYEHIKSHPTQSAKVLEPLEALHNIIPAVKHHHEHYDGKGYPDGLKGEEIPLLARILQVADVWDALTSNRSYRAAMPLEKARSILTKEAGTTMDPLLVEKFFELLDNNPGIFDHLE